MNAEQNNGDVAWRLHDTTHSDCHFPFSSVSGWDLEEVLIN
jgi:hypothetical protein